LRILHVLATLDPQSGGPAQACLEMAQSVAERGHQVSIFTTEFALDGHDGKASGLERFAALDIRTFPLDPPRFWKRSVALGRALKREIRDFDVAHIHSLYLFHDWAAARACRRVAIPYVVRPHGLLDPYIRRRHRGRKLLMELAFQNKALASAAAIHYTAELEREISTPYAHGAPPVVIPLGVKIPADRSLPSAAQREEAFPGLAGKTVMLFLGRLHRKKGLDLLIPALAAARRQHPELHLILAGPDDGALTQTTGLIAQCGLQEHITVTGMVEDRQKMTTFANTDFFVLPSYSENFAIAAVEAMSHGLPVIVSDRVNIHPDISAAGAGQVVNCTIQSLTAAIVAMAEAKDRPAIGARARQLVSEKYSWTAIGARLERLYGDLAAGRRPS
jgi:glycosyltransferase involved in cell wall biosynthesis